MSANGSVHDRVRTLRKYLGLTQEEFGKRINIKSRAHISALESGARNVTDRIANDICRVYGVNKKWLLEGEGEMRSNAETALISDVLSSLGEIDPLDMETVRLYLLLGEEHRKAFRLLVKDIAESKRHE